MFLHAHSCSFIWPETGAEQSFSAPLPAPLKSLLEQLAAPRRDAARGRRR